MKSKIFLCLLLMLTLLAFAGCSNDKGTTAPNTDGTVGINGELQRNGNYDDYTDKGTVNTDNLQNGHNTTDQSIKDKVIDK